MYNFSVIIPHKNIPGLLNRCLDSIPLRDDLQVIVVDDNSDIEVVDFSSFPGIRRSNTEIVFTKGDNGKGPGYARNVGMEKAKGKWIIFSDADDFFNDCFDDVLDQYVDAVEEIIYFKCCLQNEIGEISNNYPLINNAIENSKQSGNSDAIIYGVPCPWAKFIKRDFLINNGIKYQEITGGDDILFSIRMAIRLRLFCLSDYYLYCVVDRPGSLTRNNNWKGFYSYVLACCNAYGLLKTVSKENLAVGWVTAWWGFLWAENTFAALSLVPKIYWTMGIGTATRCIKKGIKQGAWNWKNN